MPTVNAPRQLGQGSFGQSTGINGLGTLCACRVCDGGAYSRAMFNSDTLLHPVTISQVMINFAARQGVGRQTCLLGTGIAEEDLQVADGLITRAQEMRLIENVILALPDMPALGFRIGLQYNVATLDRKSTRLNSSHVRISYA